MMDRGIRFRRLVLSNAKFRIARRDYSDQPDGTIFSLQSNGRNNSVIFRRPSKTYRYSRVHV